MEFHPAKDKPVFPAHVFVARLNGAQCRTLRAFYPRIAKTLHFPDYFGKNLDALFDCLCSLEAVGSDNIVLLIDNFDEFLSKEKAEKRLAALDVLRDAEKGDNRYDNAKFQVIGLK